MKARWLTACAALAVAAPAFPQGGGSPGRPGRMMNRFDPATVSTVNGEVVGVRQIGTRRAEGTHLDLVADGTTYDVHLGPTTFLKSKSLELQKGDRVEVTGSKVEVGGKPAIIARSVKKGDQTVTLRDEKGIPAWSRRPRR